MRYIKTYCYADYELDYIKAQLIASENEIDCVVVYEYDVTHRGEPKPFRLAPLIKNIDPVLRKRLEYRPVSIKNIAINTQDSSVIHKINEPIQRSFFYNDDFFSLEDNDFIIDCDVDEIIYNSKYRKIRNLSRVIGRPMSLPLNTFFYKKNYLWTNLKFISPTAYHYYQVKNPVTILDNGFEIKHRRDLKIRFPIKCGAHMSWNMPVESMILKLKSYSHPEYEKYANIDILQKAVDEKKYIFDVSRKFKIKELPMDDKRIPEW
jgi:hypothetical protein